MPDFDKLAHRLLYELTGEQAYTKGEHDTLRAALIAVHNGALEEVAAELTDNQQCTAVCVIERLAADWVRAKKVAPLSAPDVTT
jgi:hypothetical protein